MDDLDLAGGTRSPRYTPSAPWHAPTRVESMPGANDPARDAGADASASVTSDEGAAAAHAAEQNRLLRGLPLADYARLLPQLTPVRLRARRVLIEPGTPLSHVWFVRAGGVSLLATDQEGGDIEVGTAGPEGLVGLPLVFADDTMPHRVVVQPAAEAWRLDADAFRRALDDRPALRTLCLRYAAYYTNQVSQLVACNRLHTLDERAARWLLTTHDRVAEARFELTHAFLARMLGVRRAGVSVAMGTLQDTGIVRYTRGRVTVIDRARLEEASCGCYRVTRAALDRLLG